MLFADLSTQRHVMKIELAAKTSLPSLLVDEFCYRVLRVIQRRAHLAPGSVGAVCGLTSDLITHRLISTGSFERSQIEAIDSLVSSGFHQIGGKNTSDSIFIDVGANIGLFTNRYSRYFKRTLAFEPSPITFALLRANVTLCGSSNATLLECALSNRSSTMRLSLRPSGNLGQAQLIRSDSADGGEATAEVRVERLDAVLEEVGESAQVALMKIDVEGHELEVLEGAEKCLRRDAPVILYENNHVNGGDPCVKFLMNLGYDRFYIFKRKVSIGSIFSNTVVSAIEIDPGSHSPAALVCAVRSDAQNIPGRGT